MNATVVGGGLAGSEAAWALAERGVTVVLREMRPGTRTPAHQTDRLAELVCSNSFKSVDLTNAHGLLKAELRALGSLLLSGGSRNKKTGNEQSQQGGHPVYRWVFVHGLPLKCNVLGSHIGLKR